MFGREGLGSVPDMVPPVGQVESSDQLLQLSHLYPAVCGSVLAQPLSPPFPLSPAFSPGALSPLTQGSDPKVELRGDQTDPETTRREAAWLGQGFEGVVPRQEGRKETQLS